MCQEAPALGRGFPLPGWALTRTAFPLPSLRFVETVELQISLKNYDPQKDKRFSGTVRFGILLLPPSLQPASLPLPPGPAAGQAGCHSSRRTQR